MNIRQLNKQLLVSIIMVCCYQEIWAGMLIKRARAKNTTTVHKETYQATKQHKVTHKTKTITTTTTVEPNLETTTLPFDFNLAERSAFINNKFVADDEEPLAYTSPPFYHVLQQHQMQREQLNPADKLQDHNNDSPHIKADLDNGDAEAEKLPEKPIFGHDVGVFDDYEEEETSDYGSDTDYMIENFHHNPESLADNDEDKGQVKEIFDNAGPNIFEPSFQNKPSDSSDQNNPSEYNNYGLPTHPNEGALQNDFEIKKPIQQWDSNENNGATKSETKSKPNNQYNTQNDYLQTKPNAEYQQIHQVPTKQYLQANPLQHYDYTSTIPLTIQNSFDKLKPPRHQKPYINIEKTPANFHSHQMPTRISKPFGIQQTKPVHSLNNKTSHGTSSSNFYNNTDSASSSNILTTSSFLPGSSIFPNPSLMQNFPYDNSNTAISSPFSTTAGHSNKFKTISSSVQYVSTPDADLVFKYSIGMAQHSNSKVGHNSSDNQVQIFNLQNDIDAKTE